jgi:alpha-L-arabinofuranosidase
MYLGIANMNLDDGVAFSVDPGSTTLKKVSSLGMTCQRIAEHKELGKPAPIAPQPYREVPLSGQALKLDIPAKSVLVGAVE